MRVYNPNNVMRTLCYITAHKEEEALKHWVKLENEKLEVSCSPTESVLHAIIRSHPNHPMHGCMNGGCGICKVRVVKGCYDSGLMSAAQVDPQERAQGYALACRIYPKSDMTVDYIGKN